MTVKSKHKKNKFKKKYSSWCHSFLVSSHLLVLTSSSIGGRQSSDCQQQSHPDECKPTKMTNEK